MHKLLLSLLSTLYLNGLELKIASYNVENLFDMQRNGTEYDDYIPQKHNWTRTIFQKKLLNISEVICDVNADIIGLQEIENRNTVKKLQQALRKVGCNYKYFAITNKKRSATQVALLSKIPIVTTKEIEVNRKLHYRPILESKFMIEGKALYIYVNHWTSKHSPESRRVISAKVLARRLKMLKESTDYILLGDFNSNYNEYLHLKKEHNDTHGLVGINHILKTVMEGGQLVHKKEIQQSKRFLHYNLWLELPSFQRWSHNFYGLKQGLDAIILPKSMFDAKGINYLNNSFQVFKPKYLFHKKGYIYRWQYRKKRHLGEGYSDHLPIVATFSTTPYRFDRGGFTMRYGTIAQLYKADNLPTPLFLKDVKVILKTKHHAIIKQRKKGRAIFVYGAEGLEEGIAYDIVVEKVKNYHGLHEIVGFRIEHQYKKENIEAYYFNEALNFDNRALENEVVKSLEGLYNSNRLEIGEHTYPIYFKNRASRPKDGSYLKLKKVQIGYYNGLQLVVWE